MKKHKLNIAIEFQLFFRFLSLKSLITVPNMKLTTSLLALSATAALAAPTSDVTLDKRATTGVYLCNDRDFTGYCVHIPSAPSACVPLARDLNNLVSSAGPDQGSFCYFFV